MFLDALIDACLDTLKLLPFLFLTYLFMEWLEHGAGKRMEGAIARGGKLGPLVGAVLGIIPQCGFSGAAATLYAARVVTLGTLVSVFLVTSDEMLPIMISQAVPPVLIAQVLGVKVIAGLVAGYLLDAILTRTGRLHAGLASPKRHEGHEGHDICELCEEEGCSCCHDHDACKAAHIDGREACGGEHEHEHEHEHGACGHDHGHAHGHGGIVLPALRHSLSVSVFILVVTLLINLLAQMGLDDALAGVGSTPFASAAVAGVLGLIPNCAISVGITQLYLDGMLGGGALIAGLTVNSGVGLLVLFRTNRDINENLKIMGILVLVGILAGCIVQAAGWF